MSKRIRRKKNQSIRPWWSKRKKSKKGQYSEVFWKWMGLVGKVLGLGLIIVGVGLVAVWWLAGVKAYWNQVNRINVLVVGEKTRNVGLVSYSPSERKMVGLWFGGEVMVPVVRGYGQYRLGVLRDLGFQEQRGHELLEESVSLWLGVPVAGTIEVGELDYSRFSKFGGTRRSLLTSRSGSLGWADRISLFQKMADLGSNQIKLENLEEGGWFEQKADLTGNMMVTASEVVVNRLTQEYLVDELVLGDSGVGLAVINATSYEGLATRAANISRMMGYDVLSVANSLEKSDLTKLLVMPEVEMKEYYLDPISKLFGVEVEVDEDVEAKYRVEMVLIVGDDFYQKLFVAGE